MASLSIPFDLDFGGTFRFSMFCSCCCLPACIVRILFGPEQPSSATATNQCSCHLSMFLCANPFGCARFMFCWYVYDCLVSFRRQEYIELLKYMCCMWAHPHYIRIFILHRYFLCLYIYFCLFNNTRWRERPGTQPDKIYCIPFRNASSDGVAYIWIWLLVYMVVCLLFFLFYSRAKHKYYWGREGALVFESLWILNVIKVGYWSSIYAILCIHSDAF